MKGILPVVGGSLLAGRDLFDLVPPYKDLPMCGSMGPESCCMMMYGEIGDDGMTEYAKLILYNDAATEIGSISHPVLGSELQGDGLNYTLTVGVLPNSVKPYDPAFLGFSYGEYEYGVHSETAWCGRKSLGWGFEVEQCTHAFVCKGPEAGKWIPDPTATPTATPPATPTTTPTATAYRA